MYLQTYSFVVLLLTAERSYCCCSESSVHLTVNVSNADTSTGVLFISLLISSDKLKVKLKEHSCQLCTMDTY